MKKTTMAGGVLLAVFLVMSGCSNMLLDLERAGAGGGGLAPAGDAAVTGVTLNRSTTTVLVGAGEQLVATVAPADAANKTVSWSSSDGTKATVSATGLVTGVAAGTATMTVTTTDGAFTATCEVTVADAGIYVSDASGNDATGDGSKASPYKTISRALSAANGTVLAPKYILVAAGTYDQGTTQLSISNETYVSIYGGFNADFSTRNVVNRDNPMYKTLITSGVTSQAIFANGCEYLNLDGLTIESTAASSSTLYFQPNYGVSTAITVSNCTIKVGGIAAGDQVYGVNYSGGKNHKVLDCIVDMTGLDPKRYAVGIHSTADGFHATGNTVYTAPTGTAAVQGDITGITATAGGSSGDHIYRVTGNTIVFGQAMDNILTTVVGIRYNNTYSYGSQSALFADNTIKVTEPVISAPEVYGINLNPASGETTLFVANNTIALFGSVTGAMGMSSGIYIANNRAAHLYNNTVHNGLTGSYSYGVYTQRSSAGADNPLVKNNILVVTAGSGTASGVYMNDTYPSTAEHNWVYVPNSADATAYTVSNFTGTDPALDAANDYRLRASSPADVKAGGENLYAEHDALQADKAGNARSSSGTWAVGAYNAP